MTDDGAEKAAFSSSGSPRHVPVLLSEVLAALAPRAGDTYIDGTFGAGGYTSAILAAADCRVVAIDRDPAAIAAAAPLTAEFAGRLTLVQGTFGDLEAIARESGIPRLDGVVLDIGVSSMQLDEAARGFSFMRDGPLDMRMSQAGPSAADMINTSEERELADILYEYGEERRSRAIARAIVRERAKAPITTTLALARLIESVLGRPRGDDKHPATRTFQALRIHVNDELGELERALDAAERMLAPGGRLVVVAFHSLEDRIVKRFLARRAGREGRGSRHMPVANVAEREPSFRILNQRPIHAREAEIATNPRSRSAVLRAAVRTSAPAFPHES
ncbi:MAG TPA: 16S rRNA (cytosine(1402)-N(4))-methyltransferase RsmH [Hyphomicrobiaceae bacterium]|nr:16S rRNA (cytosine(1402)-N(4))-methyltransferase RsmH [Hyphomicrobiaceae bacterium]